MQYKKVLFSKPVFAYRKPYFLHWQTILSSLFIKDIHIIAFAQQFLIRISKIFVSYIDVLTLIRTSAQDTYQSFGSCMYL